MKLIIASIIIFSLVILFLFSLFPADISVSRLVNIHQSQLNLNRSISDLGNWKNWNVFTSSAKNSQELQDRITGANSGSIVTKNGTVQIIKTSGDTIFTKWENGSHFFLSDFVLTKINKNQVVVEWTMHFHLRWYPWEKLAGMFYDKQLGPQMEQSLLNLQKFSESVNHTN